MLYEIVG